MELFLVRHAEWKRLYNCTGIDVNSVPLAQRRQFVPEACLTIALCALYYLLYVPCMCSIWKHRRDVCYQLLFYIGAMDMSVLWIIGFLHGWLALQGAVFCSYPRLIYVTGGIALVIWIAESTADLLLAINRCLMMFSPWLTQKLFDGFRTHFWLTLCSGYALYWLFFQKPIIFTALHFAWFFQPFIGYREDIGGEFAAPLHSLHDSLVAIGSPLIYLLFAFAFAIKMRNYRHQQPQERVPITHAEKMNYDSKDQAHSKELIFAFLQVFIISAINTICASIYMLMQHITPEQWMITVAEFAWFHIHGFPPVIYLCLNHTIRNDCRQLVVKLCQQLTSSCHCGCKSMLRWNRGVVVQPASTSGTIVVVRPAGGR